MVVVTYRNHEIKGNPIEVAQTLLYLEKSAGLEAPTPVVKVMTSPEVKIAPTAVITRLARDKKPSVKVKKTGKVEPWKYLDLSFYDIAALEWRIFELFDTMPTFSKAVIKAVASSSAPIELDTLVDQLKLSKAQITGILGSITRRCHQVFKEKVFLIEYKKGYLIRKCSLPAVKKYFKIS